MLSYDVCAATLSGEIYLAPWHATKYQGHHQMHRRTLIIGIALASLWHASLAQAQAEDLEVTMNVVLDEAADVERVVMTIIEEELSSSEAGQESLRNTQLETQRHDREDFPHRADFADPDAIDDGLFDDYDDGEAIETGIDEGQALSSAG